MKVNGGATPIGVASSAWESNDTVATKCGRLNCGFSQCYMVLRHGLRHRWDEGCMVFMQGMW